MVTIMIVWKKDKTLASFFLNKLFLNRRSEEKIVGKCFKETDEDNIRIGYLSFSVICPISVSLLRL
jgi:hypothetical protein